MAPSSITSPFYCFANLLTVLGYVRPSRISIPPAISPLIPQPIWTIRSLQQHYGRLSPSEQRSTRSPSTPGSQLITPSDRSSMIVDPSSPNTPWSTSKVASPSPEHRAPSSVHSASGGAFRRLTIRLLLSPQSLKGTPLAAWYRRRVYIDIRHMIHLNTSHGVERWHGNLRVNGSRRVRAR